MKVVMWLWQLPQHLLGMVLILASGARRTVADRTLYVAYAGWFSNMGICLGDIIIIGQDSWGEFSIRHEKMHQRQSHLLGPMYLPTVGIVSIIRNIYGRLMKKPLSWYYNAWPENWVIGDRNEDDDNQGDF